MTYKVWLCQTWHAGLLNEERGGIYGKRKQEAGGK